VFLDGGREHRIELMMEEDCNRLQNKEKFVSTKDGHVISHFPLGRATKFWSKRRNQDISILVETENTKL